jgi:integrase
MRRGAITRIKLVDVNMAKRVIAVQEKGGEVHKYHISKEGMKAIEDYIAHERGQDGASALSLFLPAASVGIKNDHLSERTINNLWNQVREAAMVDADKTPHSARHGMGKHIMEKTGNVSAIQRQLGHKNPAYSMQYARISSQELHDVLDDRE